MEFTEKELNIIRHALECYLDEIFHVDDTQLKGDARALLQRIVQDEIRSAEEAVEAGRLAD